MKIGIIGAAGYAAGKLIELLLSHKLVEMTCLVSESHAGIPVGEVHTHLKGLLDLEFQDSIYDAEFVFSCKGPGQSINLIPKLLSKNLRVIDLSADYRLRGVDHKHKETLVKAVYGLPELHYDKIQETTFVANPGCFPTGAILGMAPLFGSIKTVILDSVSGISGAGRTSKGTVQFIDVDDNIRPYKTGTHRHMHEIEQEIGMPLLFSPQVGPFKFGISSKIYLTLKDAYTEEGIMDKFKEFYKDKPFVRVSDKAEIKDVVGSNFCDISIRYFGNYIIVFTAIDNVIKGAAGQAIQNMNIMCSFHETEGLPFGLALRKN